MPDGRGCDKHLNDVADDHDDERHSTEDDMEEAVWLVMPKSKPFTVTDANQLSGVLSRVSDTTAASKLKAGRPVPANDATVTLNSLNRSPKGFEVHATVVTEVHDEVKHTPRSPAPPRSSPAVAVCSPAPKFRPDTVTQAYPVCGAFISTSDITAASKLKTARPVPDTAATVTLALPKISANAKS